MATPSTSWPKTILMVQGRLSQTATPASSAGDSDRLSFTHMSRDTSMMPSAP